MSRRAIIEARGVGKQYRLGERAAGYGSLRESLSGLARASLRRLRGSRPAPLFWALDEVSFDVQPGEALGIVGRNGAGKSTLLKILSRITAPTRGEIRLRGRVASLLEVGTGFHPELTGRENVFLSGAVLGMSRAEIRESFDAIVAFAEVEQFLDTPVKRYSSGMYVRLAFAVAAHLRPEILVIDEVLAVGDAAFQKRCLGKMHDVAAGGRTVLFVSHNMAAVTRLCSRALLLKQGRIVADGRADAIVSEYIRGGAGDTPISVDFEALGKRPGTEHVRLLGARVRSAGMESALVDIRRAVYVEIDYEVLQQRLPIQPNFQVNNEEGVSVFVANDSYAAANLVPRPAGRYRATAEIPGNLLSEGMFSLDIGLTTTTPFMPHCWERGALTFQVYDPAEGDSSRGAFVGAYPGVTRPLLAWTTAPLPSTRATDARAEGVA
jgi:lipopolysaccharide transport system ATP-binding protein